MDRLLTAARGNYHPLVPGVAAGVRRDPSLDRKPDIPPGSLAGTPGSGLGPIVRPVATNLAHCDDVSLDQPRAREQSGLTA